MKLATFSCLHLVSRELRPSLPAHPARIFRAIAAAGLVALGCVKPIKLYPEARRSADAVARLRVDGATLFGKALKVRRGDDDFGIYGGALGSHLNAPSNFRTKLDLVPGPRAIEASYREIRGVVLRGDLAGGVEHTIVPVEGRENCLQLAEKGGKW